MKPDLSVIIISPGRTDDLPGRLDDLVAGLTGREAELWLVQTGSAEPAEEQGDRIETLRADHPEINFIFRPDDSPPWAGVNRALRLAGADRALIIGPDREPDPAAWAAMLDRLDRDDRIGLVFSRSVGPVEPWGEPFLFRTLLDRLTAEPGAPPASADPNRCTLVRLAAAENIGLLDERLPALEKIDWARRMKRSGWRIDQVSCSLDSPSPAKPGPTDYVDQYRSGLFYLHKWSPSSHLAHRIGLGTALGLDLVLALVGAALALGASPARRNRLAIVAALVGWRLGLAGPAR